MSFKSHWRDRSAHPEIVFKKKGATLIVQTLTNR